MPESRAIEARPIHRKARTDWIGAALTWLSGGALAFQISMVVGLLVLLGWYGLSYLWQSRVVELRLTDGTRTAGEIHAEEPILDHEHDKRVLGTRLMLKVGNQDLYGHGFRWIDRARIQLQESPADLVLLERMEYGNFYGRLLEVRDGERTLARGSWDSGQKLRDLLPEIEALRARIRRLEKGPQAELGRGFSALRLAERRLELQKPGPASEAAQRAELARRKSELTAQSEELSRQLDQLRDELGRRVAVAETSDGKQKTIALGQIVRVVRPNALTLPERAGLWLSRAWELVSDDPRESNTEGGIFPAIFGTVLMVVLMTMLVTPLGVLAALYLHEYARQGAFVRLVRIAVNNLAGVPSIVFGVFGLGFFVYGIGGSIDRLFFPEALPSPTFGTGGMLWAALTLALLTVPVVIVATEEGLAAVPRNTREGSSALGATKLETTWRVVLPAAMPGVLTGVILAIARAAGEVAPLMIVGMVKLAPLPLDGTFPFLHPEAKFMHLGFHIYDVGLQSPNVDAAKPLVFATALLLVTIVTVMNLLAIWLRNNLRRKYATSAV